MKERRANGGREDPHTYCMPPNFPVHGHCRKISEDRADAEHDGGPARIQRRLPRDHLDGRPLPENPNPTWNGYSTGHWEGDTLVIETNGIRDDMWLDIQGSPITESARVTEKLRRINFGIMQVEITVNDPKAYTKPWTVTIEMAARCRHSNARGIVSTTNRTSNSTRNDEQPRSPHFALAWPWSRRPWRIIPSPNTTHARKSKSKAQSARLNGRALTPGFMST